jgi:hypothetical protein
VALVVAAGSRRRQQATQAVAGHLPARSKRHAGAFSLLLLQQRASLQWGEQRQQMELHKR